MLTIDLKPGKYNPQRIKLRATPSTYSLNRAQRIRELTRVTQENKMLLQRLQSAHSVYDHNKKPIHQFPRPNFKATNEPRIMSAVGGRRFGYATMPIKARRAKSSYAVARRGKKKKRRLMTAGHGGRKRSAVSRGPQNNRPITAKGPLMGRRNQKSEEKEEPQEPVQRPDTVAFTNMGPLGATEPQDGDDRIKQEITREVTGESEREIEARIGNEDEISKESDHEEQEAPKDKFNEKEKKIDNLTDDLSNNQDKQKSEDGDNNDDQNKESRKEANDDNDKIVNKENQEENIKKSEEKDEDKNLNRSNNKSNRSRVKDSIPEKEGNKEMDEGSEK